jgi:hypothetical protein
VNEGHRDTCPPAFPASWAEPLPVAPASDGAAILLPAVVELPGRNHDDVAGIHSSHQSIPARREVLRLALEWTGRYRDVPVNWVGLCDDAVKLGATGFFLAGHQGTLFHPGVWFKNFVLDRLARRFDGVAINLVIDDEPEAMAGVRTPFMSAEGLASWHDTLFDDPAETVPGELRRLKNPAVFESFANRLTRAVRPWVKEPLVEAFWPHAVQEAENFDALPHLIAAARHRFEADLGLKTLEVPLSRLCETGAFAHFAAEILSRGLEFARIYNEVLGEFRKAQGIRSPNHPVPPLVLDETGVELPFWLFSRDDPVRRRVCAREENGLVHLFAGGSGWERRTSPDRLAEMLQELPARGIRFRPRALLTTMFARLLLADRFVHGIGGALYDRVTDRIAGLFFGVRLPGFITATGTWRWIPWHPGQAESELQPGRRLLRELEQQPERHVGLDEPGAATLIEAKRSLLARMGERAGRLERQKEMERINKELRRMVEPMARRLANDLESGGKSIAQNQIIASREIPFVAHPVDLPGKLAAAADRLVGLGNGKAPEIVAG